MSELVPTGDEVVEGARGRAPFIAARLSRFTVGVDGNDPIKPMHREIAYDDIQTGSIGRMMTSPGSPLGFVFESVEMELLRRFDELEYSGVFKNAQAAALGRDLEYLLFDTQNNTLKLNPALAFPSAYRYYAVSLNGEYITSRTLDGKVVVLTDMDNTVIAKSGDGIVSVPEIATILPGVPIVDSDLLTVEFFDVNRHVINTRRYWAYAIKLMSNDNTTDVGITGIEVITTRPVNGEPNSCYLYLGEDVNQLGIRVLLRYTDGNYREITHELDSTGRLEIVGLTALDVDTVTPIGDQPTENFTVKYYAVDTDGSVGNYSIEETISLYVRDDPNSVISRIIPAHYIITGDESTIVSKFYAIYDNGRVVCVDNNVQSLNIVDGSGTLSTDTDIIQKLNLILAVGTSGNITKSFRYMVKWMGTTPTLVEVCNGDNDATFVNNVLDLTFTTSTTKLKMISPNAVNPASEMIDATAITHEGSATPVAPNRMRVRTVEGDHFYIGGTGVEITNGVFFDGTTMDQGLHPLKEHTPVLVEFIYVDPMNPSSVEVTDMRLAYVTINTI